MKEIYVRTILLQIENICYGGCRNTSQAVWRKALQTYGADLLRSFFAIPGIGRSS